MLSCSSCSILGPGEERLTAFLVQDKVTGIRAGAVVVKDRKVGLRDGGARESFCVCVRTHACMCLCVWVDRLLYAFKSSM